MGGSFFYAQMLSGALMVLLRTDSIIKRSCLTNALIKKVFYFMIGASKKEEHTKCFS
jgi:hypothetical protein